MSRISKDIIHFIIPFSESSTNKLGKMSLNSPARLFAYSLSFEGVTTVHVLYDDWFVRTVYLNSEKNTCIGSAVDKINGMISINVIEYLDFRYDDAHTTFLVLLKTDKDIQLVSFSYNTKEKKYIYDEKICLLEIRDEAPVSGFFNSDHTLIALTFSKSPVLIIRTRQDYGVGKWEFKVSGSTLDYAPLKSRRFLFPMDKKSIGYLFQTFSRKAKGLGDECILLLTCACFESHSILEKEMVSFETKDDPIDFAVNRNGTLVGLVFPRNEIRLIFLNDIASTRTRCFGEDVGLFGDILKLLFFGVNDCLLLVSTKEMFLLDKTLNILWNKKVIHQKLHKIWSLEFFPQRDKKSNSDLILMLEENLISAVSLPKGFGIRDILSFHMIKRSCDQVLELIKLELNNEAEAPKTIFTFCELLISSRLCKKGNKIDLMSKFLNQVWEFERYINKKENNASDQPKMCVQIRQVRYALINNLIWHEGDWESTYKLATIHKDVAILKMLRHFAEINEMPMLRNHLAILIKEARASENKPGKTKDLKEDFPEALENELEKFILEGREGLDKAKEFYAKALDINYK